MLIAAALLGIGLVVEVFCILRAPIGYQDETGFHELTANRNGEETVPNPSPGSFPFGEYPVPR